MIGIVKLALRRPYTFIVMALLIMIFGVASALRTPTDISSDDPTAAAFKTTVDNGTVFRVVRYEPGVVPRNHRTDSIDYAVVVSGEIDMQLDDGVIVKLKAGDALVQRGTIHNWVNRGKEDCVVAFILISGKPISAGGKTLTAVG
jgi:quercetin dioxygenase-like cupin family protein